MAIFVSSCKCSALDICRLPGRRLVGYCGTKRLTGVLPLGGQVKHFLACAFSICASFLTAHDRSFLLSIVTVG